MRKQYGRHVNFNYSPRKIKFGAFRLKLAKKCKKSPDRHRQQWTFRLNCTDIYIRYFDDVIMTSRRETKMGDQVIFISYPLKFDLV